MPMSHDGDDLAPLPPVNPAEEDSVQVDVEIDAEPPPPPVDLATEPASAPRAAPPPKPKPKSPSGSVRPPAPAVLPAPPLRSEATPRASSSKPPGSGDRPPPSIQPMRMIKLGDDRPRSEPPASSLERLSSKPPPAASFDPPTEPIPRIEDAPAPADSFDPPTPPRIEVSVYEGAEDEPTPTTPHVPPPARPMSSPPVHSQRSKPPPPPSARAAQPSSPELDLGAVPAPFVAPPVALVVTPPTPPATQADTTDVPEVEASPSSEDEPQPISIEVASTTTEPPVDAPAEKRKPPPPPKRDKAAPPAPSEHAVQKALEAPKFEPPSPKPRAKPWWEDLFTDDFARGILPLSEAQVRREVNFIEESLGVAKGGVVLDLACGTGHHAVDLSSRGYGVVGFDLSLPQLAIAGEYAQERGQKINFLQGDMRDMSFDEVFDGIYCWNTSFGYFEEERNVAVAERVFKALRPGGNFLLDVINRDFLVEHQPSQVWFEGDACVCMDDMSVDFITSRLRVKRTMMLDDGRTRECTYSIRVYSLHELGKILHDIGFRVTEASGHIAYPGVFFGATSPRVVILAQKP
ncbi:MAG TPA: methyltransferase domain-containing protein [Polyangiaceae bacterium]|nr:methyltransferase domain-containing protein [Polyangiaceae bacterium]